MIRLIALLALVSAPLQAKTLRATPESFPAVAKAAKGGDTIILDRSRQFGDVRLPPANHAVPVTIDATGTKLTSLTIRGTSGWKWVGGTIDAPLPPKAWVTVMIDGAKRIEVAGATLTGGQTGVLVTRGSEDIVLRENIATGLRSDGFNIATATRVSLIGNTCKDFKPIPPVFQGKKMIKDGTHPDCIQIWSEKGKPPTSDIAIIGNRIGGGMQGITNFGALPPERVRIWDNDIEMSGFWWAIAMKGTKEADIRNNTVRTLPGSTAFGRPDVPARANVQADNGNRCGNRVDGKADRKC
ncbi:hypothetical protein [Qipengyuania sp.]|uniref:hypothetical protein n=1 Tax=Qipengyuania sp. TaxID=2004515 RepID=UPI0035C84E63